MSKWLDTEVALEVMGWRLDPSRPGFFIEDLVEDPSKAPFFAPIEAMHMVENWNPSTNIADAMAAAAIVISAGFEFSLESKDGRLWFARFVDQFDLGGGSGGGEAAAEAIATGALYAMRIKKEMGL